MSNRIRRFREWLLNRKAKKKIAELEKKEKQLKEIVEFIVRQEQPLINTLEGKQKENEEAKLKEKIDTLTVKHKKQINKLRGELIKMSEKSKLKIVDGKLTRVAPDQQQEPQEQPQPEMPQDIPMPPPEFQQQAPPVEQPMPNPMNQFVQEPQVPPQEFIQPTQVPPMPQQSVQQPMYEQPMPQQPMYEQPMPQQSAQMTVTIFLTEGRELSVEVMEEEASGFFTSLNEAIESQSTMQIGRQVICGRYIISYSF